MRKFICLIFIFSLLRAGIFEILGGQKVGTTSFVFLKIGVGAKAVAMGETFVSLADDATACYWNPAGIAFIRNSSLCFTHTDWFLDIIYDYSSVVFPVGTYSSIGIELGGLHSGYMEETDEYHPFGTGRYFYFGDYFTGINYARLISDRFSFGFTVKLITEILGDLKSYGYALDLGTLYHIGYRDIRVGVSLSNLGPDVRPQGIYQDENGVEKKYEAFSLPIVYRMGVSGFLFSNLKGAFQIDKPSDNVETFKVGFEFTPIKNFLLRGGYRLNNRGPGRSLISSGLSLGAGFKAKLKNKIFSLDYSISGMGYIGDVQRLSINLEL